MIYTPIGLPVAKEVLEAMRLATERFWYEWQKIYDAATDEVKEALQKELQEILEACRAGSTPETDDHLVKARAADATTVGGLMEKTIDSDTITRELVTDGGVEKVRFNGKRPSKIRYYLSDTHGTGDWTGHLLLTSNPYDEGSAIDLTTAANLSEFVSPPGSPGLTVWNGGLVHAHLRIKLTGTRVGRTYKLYTGNGDLVYSHLVGDWTSGDVYQVAPYPDQPAVTETYVTLDFDVPVATLAAGNTHRFELKLMLRAYVGASEDALDGEQLVIRVGGTDASYLDTPFTPSGGFAGLHNDLDGREAANAHPMSAITPGRIQTPSNAIVTTSSGLFAMPSNSNFVVIDGAEDLIGCSTADWLLGNPCIEFMVFSARKILKSQNPLPDGYAPFVWGYMNTGYAGDYDVIEALTDSVYRCRLIGGVWRICSMMNV